MPEREPASSSIQDWHQAEHAAAAHMRDQLKFTSVRLSRAGADDGVDVKAVEGVAQVKWYSSPVGIAEVQRLRGSTSGSQWALFYSGPRGYTKSAKEAATRGNVALFTLLPATGMGVAVNHVAQSLERMRLGIPQKTKSDGEMDLGAFMATSRRHWELNEAIRVYGRRVDKVWRAVTHMQSVLRDLERHEPEAAVALRSEQVVWAEEDDPTEYVAAHREFKRAIDWHRHFPEGAETSKVKVIAFQEAVLPQLPKLVSSFIATVPVPRDQLDDWCDHWTDRSFWAEYEPRRTMPRNEDLRENLERRIARGPSSYDLERHAEAMAVRVVR